MKHIDLVVHQLCEEIDYYKSEAQYWKEKYEQEVQERVTESKERLAETQKGVANMLRFALSCTDGEDGSLIITPEDRKELAENWSK